MSEPARPVPGNPNAARIREINDTIRYAMWSVFAVAEPIGDEDRDALATEVEELFTDVAQRDDVVRGTVSFHTDVIGDPVIVRADGIPAYNYAVVIDDALMRITHVVRGEDHISNTPRQILVSSHRLLLQLVDHAALVLDLLHPRSRGQPPRCGARGCTHG